MLFSNKTILDQKNDIFYKHFVQTYVCQSFMFWNNSPNTRSVPKVRRQVLKCFKEALSIYGWFTYAKGKSIVWFWSSIHSYHHAVGTTEHFGNISWRQSTRVVLNHGFKWTKIFYLLYIRLRIFSINFVFFYFISFKTKFLVICTYTIVASWILKWNIFPLLVLPVSKQKANHYEWKWASNNVVFS